MPSVRNVVPFQPGAVCGGKIGPRMMQIRAALTTQPELNRLMVSKEFKKWEEMRRTRFRNKMVSVVAMTLILTSALVLYQSTSNAEQLERLSEELSAVQDRYDATKEHLTTTSVDFYTSKTELHVAKNTIKQQEDKIKALEADQKLLRDHPRALMPEKVRKLEREVESARGNLEKTLTELHECESKDDQGGEKAIKIMKAIKDVKLVEEEGKEENGREIGWRAFLLLNGLLLAFVHQCIGKLRAKFAARKEPPKVVEDPKEEGKKMIDHEVKDEKMTDAEDPPRTAEDETESFQESWDFDMDMEVD